MQKTEKRRSPPATGRANLLAFTCNHDMPIPPHPEKPPEIACISGIYHSQPRDIYLQPFAVRSRGTKNAILHPSTATPNTDPYPSATQEQLRPGVAFLITGASVYCCQRSRHPLAATSATPSLASELPNHSQTTPNPLPAPCGRSAGSWQNQGKIIEKSQTTHKSAIK